jgi:mannitol 2-dehydrogenase
MIALSDSTLNRLPPAIAVPRYDRRALKAGVVHVGVGNFHRTHQALYVDEALHQPGNEGFGICGVGLAEGDASRAKAAAYKAQDGLYTVTEFSPDGTARTRVIGAMIDYLHGPADPEAVLARLTHSDLRVVTLTITEGGYNIDETTGVFRLEAPEVAHDLAGGEPRTVFGYVVEALARQRRHCPQGICVVRAGTRPGSRHLDRPRGRFSEQHGGSHRAAGECSVPGQTQRVERS